jgi:hypothetical protein
MKRIFGILIILLIMITANRTVKTYPLEQKVTNGPDFELVDFKLVPDDFYHQAGIYKLVATIKNNGSGSATSGEVPHAWEKIYYELTLANGVGTLDESLINHDLNGDSDKTDTFDVTWFHNDSRQWDAVIDGGHAYSFWEGSPENPWKNQTFYVKGKPKLFQLGSVTHSLYFANNTIARFGLIDAQVLIHPSPNFELELDSDLRAIGFLIDDDEVEVNYTQTRERFIGGSSSNITVYVIPNHAFEIDNRTQITFKGLLLMNKTKMTHLELSMNWSPDAKEKETWRLIDQEMPMEAVELPFFGLDFVNLELKKINLCEIEFTGTIQNFGAPASTGIIMVPWEKTVVYMPLTGGEGTLDENIIDSDLNGDGDNADTFSVSWFHNETRQWDAKIDGIHAYAVLEQDPSLWWYNFSWYLNGKLKHFQLGNQTHVLYGASSGCAAFAFGDVSFLTHPSPNYQLYIATSNKSSLDKISVTNFKINGEPVTINHTWTMKDVDLEIGWILFYKIYIIPNKASHIATGEKVTISGTFKANDAISFSAFSNINWSPDGNKRHKWWILFPDLNLEGCTSPTTFISSATSTSTMMAIYPSFLFTIIVTLIITILWNNRKKRKSI